MTYFFILGNNPSLSIAEILKTLKSKKIKPRFISLEFLILDSEEILEIEKLQNQLGGTIKIGEIFFEESKNLEVEKEIIKKNIYQLLETDKKKIKIGCSFYGFEDLESVKITEIFINKIIGEIKVELGERGVGLQKIAPERFIFSSADLAKKKILKQGEEIVLLFRKNRIFIGKTIVCQDFKKYILYDIKRPARVIKKGMIPPKLAKIMINLGINSINGCFLDPFCGSGTIIQQAVLAGFKGVIGTDKDKRIIKEADKNLSWLGKKNNLDLKGLKIFYSDARRISQKIRPHSITLIATEPYLGPLKFKPSECSSIIRELKELYLAVFQEFKKILKIGQKMVIIFPIFIIGNKQYDLKIINEIEKNGWILETAIDFSSLMGCNIEKGVIKITPRNSIIYSRPKQTVLREIFIFKNI